MLRKYKWTSRFIVLTPILILISFFLLGGGHGWIEPIVILFPFATIQFIRTSTIDLGFILVSIIQYPVYGILLDLFSKKNQVILLLVIVHILVAIVSYSFIPEQF